MENTEKLSLRSLVPPEVLIRMVPEPREHSPVGRHETHRGILQRVPDTLLTRSTILKQDPDLHATSSQPIKLCLLTYGCMALFLLFVSNQRFLPGCKIKEICISVGI